MRKAKKIYAAYRGEEYIGEGTLREIAAMTGLKEESVRWYTSNAAKRQAVEHVERKSRPRLTLVDLTEEETE